MFALDPELVERTRALWAGKLIRVPRTARHPDLPPVLREFVESVGLPAENCWNARFHDLAPQSPLHLRGREFAVLGLDHGVPIAVDVDQGAVWVVQSGTPRLINSSLPLFLHALGLCDHLLRDLGGARPDVREAKVDDLRATLADLDPPSMGPGCTPWQEYFDEVVSE
ncbi:SUKH-4 family immunity protein [Umezawaea endophytica]|uniref:SUKH-4 family immunity protein n=1 Tax=Umezawaea endophytica TaxID=1654476 RepID=A0A9X2VJ94_9PSEU|nr:SUKH-4 family immunity protein [Umezawaea endophytica]MCS7477129.1 SUKH-4 family immunity protein [Umezawaea endophytica]